MAFSFGDGFLADRYHTVRWIGSVELLDQRVAMFQHRALVDRALVGDLALVDRERRIQQDRARDPRRGTGGRRQKARQALAEDAGESEFTAYNSRLGRSFWKGPGK